VALALGVYVLLSAYIVWRSAILQPYSDMFDWLLRYYRLEVDGDLVGYLLAPHNFHRLVWTLGVLALDIRWFGAESYFFLASSSACLAATAALLAREAVRAAAPGLRLVAGAFAAMLTLISINLLAAGLPIHATYLHALLFAVLAVVVAEPTGDGPVPVGRRLATLACVAAACFGNAVGLALWPALLWGALRAGAGRRWTLGLAMAGALFIWLYALGQPSPGGGTLAGAQGWRTTALLVLNFLGQPWSRALPGLGWVVGLVLLALALAALPFKGGKDAPRPERVATQLILFSLGAAAMAAVGRSPSDQPWMVSVRYATLLTPLHLGLLILACPYLARLRDRRAGLVDTAAAVVAILMIVHQSASGLLVIRAADVDRAMIADFRAGHRDEAMRATIYPDLDHAAAVSARLRRDGRYQGEWHLPADPAGAPRL